MPHASTRSSAICILLLALCAPVLAQDPQCHSSHACPTTDLPDKSEDKPGSEAGKGKVQVGRYGIVKFDVSDMKKNTQMEIGRCWVDFHVKCKPDGKTDEASATPDLLQGFNKGADLCGKESKKPFLIHATISYTTKDGKTEKKEGSAPPQKDTQPDTGDPCNGNVPVGTCVTP
jgi:hypothetical protein